MNGSLGFRIGLFNFMRRTVDISVGPVKVIKFSEFVRNLVVPTNLNMVQMKPLRGTALLVFDPNLIFLFIDNLFGEMVDIIPASREEILHKLSSV